MEKRIKGKQRKPLNPETEVLDTVAPSEMEEASEDKSVKSCSETIDEMLKNALGGVFEGI